MKILPKYYSRICHVYVYEGTWSHVMWQICALICITEMPYDSLHAPIDLHGKGTQHFAICQRMLFLINFMLRLTGRSSFKEFSSSLLASVGVHSGHMEGAFCASAVGIYVIMMLFSLLCTLKI